MKKPTNDKNLYNHPEYIEYALGKIKEIDTSKISFSDLTKTIRDYIGGIPVIENTFKAGTYVARARTKSNDLPYRNLSEITLRDKEYVTSFGRAHRPNRAIFYCATDHEVAIKEATQWHITDLGVLINRKMLKDYNPHARFVTVSIWKVKEDLKLASLFLNDKAMESNSRVKYFGENIINQNENNWNENFLKSKNMILKFFSDEYAKSDIKQESDYFLSAYYANEIHTFSESTGKIDGVVYPSVAHEFRGENFAITETAYKNKLEFVKAYHNYVANVELNHRPIAVGEISETIDNQNGKLTWKDIPTGKIIE